MHRTFLAVCGVALLAISLVAEAQESAQRPFGFGNPPATAELERLPQTPGAKGDQARHYFFTAAGREMPYHLYVPASYDPKVGAPLVVALHGYGGNQDYFFAVVVKDLQALCELRLHLRRSDGLLRERLVRRADVGARRASAGERTKRRRGPCRRRRPARPKSSSASANGASRTL